MVYTEVRLVDRPRPILLRVEKDGEFLVGIEVRKDGEEVRPRGCDNRRHIIHADAIRERHPLTMDLKYAELRREGEVI